jgi:hypothetical protein
LPSEPPLDGIKESDPFGWRLEAANARQQYGRYKTDAADPQDDRKNVQRAGNRNIIHLPSLDLRRSVGLREAGMTALGQSRRRPLARHSGLCPLCPENGQIAVSLGMSALCQLSH